MRFPRLRFGLRTLLLLTVLVAIPSAWLGKHWLRTRVQRPIVAKILANGGHVYYDYQYDRGWFNSTNPPPGLEPLRKMLGDDFFATVKAAEYGHGSPAKIQDIEFEQLSELEQLNINVANVPETTIANLATLQKLESLKLSICRVSPETFRKLAQCSELKQLTINQAITSADQLRELKNLAKLTSFQWLNSQLDDDSLLVICELQQLESLDLVGSNSKSRLTARGFAGLSQLKKLQRFQMSGPADEGIAAIANAPELKSLSLLFDQLTDTGMLHLASLTKLIEFESDSAQITDAGMTALRKLLRLQWLKLESPNITDTGLANICGLTNLTHLHLNSAGISDAGIPSLLPLTELEVLELKEAKLSDQGLQQLAALTKLKRLTLTLGPHLTIEGVKKLGKRLPDCRFYNHQSLPDGSGSSSSRID